MPHHKPHKTELICESGEFHSGSWDLKNQDEPPFSQVVTFPIYNCNPESIGLIGANKYFVLPSAINSLCDFEQAIIFHSQPHAYKIMIIMPNLHGYVKYYNRIMHMKKFEYVVRVSGVSLVNILCSHHN